jgi:hypothetical protein
MTTTNDLAARLYPDLAPRAPADVAPNAAVAQLRTADATARTLYADADQWGGPADGSGGLVRELALAVRDVHPGAGAADIEHQVSSLASVLTDLGADHDLVQHMASQIKMQAGAETTPEMRETAFAVLRAEYGSDFDRKMADAKLLVARDPRLAGFMQATRLGDSPRVVRRMIELAVQQRTAGRLK